MKNTLYYGDNLDVLKKYIQDESVDLVYLDPPFNSNQDYNVLFKEKNGSQSQSQIKAFEDTWSWDLEAARTFQETVEGGGRIADMLNAMHGFLGNSDMMAYLAMMAPRLKELHRVLKPTGSIYLHCDSTASHYLKLLMDAIFGPENFKNEIIWKRSHPHGNVSRAYGTIHDVLLFYSKGVEYYWSKPHVPYFLPDGSLNPDLEGDILKQYGMVEEATGRRFQATSLLNPNPDRPNLTYEFHGHIKVWRWTKKRMEQAEKDGHLYLPKDGEGIPREKRYLDEQEGMPIQDIWTDIHPLLAQAAERLGYPTQKPEALLERIISASCPPEGIVLDPFCGCGTTVSVAHRLGRTWIGIDITHLAITLIRSRLQDAFGEVDYQVVGEPTSLADAMELAKQDRFQFQWWALGKVGCRPLIQKKGADQGIDGKIWFHDEMGTSKSKLIVISVKSGGVDVKDVRDLGHVVTREKAEIGVLITLEGPTKPMAKEAADMGFYNSPLWDQKYPRLQILTVEEILAGRKIDSPQYKADDRVKVAPKLEKERNGRQKKLTEG